MKKLNLYIGIALVAVILIALYFTNGQSIFEGNEPAAAAKPPPEIKIPNAPKNPYNVNATNYGYLKEIEQILSGALKLEGKGKTELAEYYEDLKTNSVCTHDKTADFTAVDVKNIISVNNNEPISIIEIQSKPAPTKLSYNDTFQVIYAFGKVTASTTPAADFSTKFKDLTPYFYIYSIFTSKLNVNINKLMVSNDAASMTVLSNILNSYYYSVVEEGVSPPSNINVSFLSTLSYVIEIFRRIYQSGSGGWPTAITAGTNPFTDRTFFLCNFNGKANSPKTLGVLNYTIPNLLKTINDVVTKNSPVSVNKDITPTDPLFMQRLASSVEPSKDVTSIFASYKNIGGTNHADFYTKDIVELNKALPSGAVNKKIVPWFSQQPAAMSGTPYLS
jgi:hypothetical protein